MELRQLSYFTTIVNEGNISPGSQKTEYLTTAAQPPDEASGGGTGCDAV